MRKTRPGSIKKLKVEIFKYTKLQIRPVQNKFHDYSIRSDTFYSLRKTRDKKYE